ncbi:MAG: DmsE family decaheme c-type cytochrome [Rhodospirillaceae bacterium]|nr:DmsE family decaheme c-type cytochrome [Rhodospirillaceae bacterium]
MGIILRAGVLIAALFWAMSAHAQDAARGLGEPTEVKACLNCHDDPKVTGVLHTAHGVKGDARTEVAGEGCQSCHGDSLAHMARLPDGAMRPPPEINFSGPNISTPELQTKTCLGCHEGGARMHWPGSQHAGSDVTCAACHDSHPVRDPVLSAATQAPVCFTCHAEQRAAALKPSHHPVTEGQMSCSDCHNPHGSVGPKLLVADTVNDTCVTCHDEKRGPMLFDHPPVQEDCSICHTPHGSVQVALLKQRPPYLCQNCHDSTLHNSQPFSGASIPGGAAPSRMMVLRGCLNCHSQVHGSNHPSGIRFAR